MPAGPFQAAIREGGSHGVRGGRPERRLGQPDPSKKTEVRRGPARPSGPARYERGGPPLTRDPPPQRGAYIGGPFPPVGKYALREQPSVMGTRK